MSNVHGKINKSINDEMMAFHLYGSSSYGVSGNSCEAFPQGYYVNVFGAFGCNINRRTGENITSLTPHFSKLNFAGNL